MNAKNPFLQDDFKKCTDFHGHTCPGLSIGYRASKATLDRLQEKRSEDEEVVAIVETDACGADAIQVLTGCTFGKGNFIFKDHGKQVFTLLSRKTGKGVRAALKAGAIEPTEEQKKLMDRVRNGTANEAEKEEFQRLHLERSREILTRPLEEIFTVTEVDVILPEPARIEPSIPCAQCGEPTMASKLVERGSQQICQDCFSG